MSVTEHRTVLNKLFHSWGSGENEGRNCGKFKLYLLKCKILDIVRQVDILPISLKKHKRLHCFYTEENIDFHFSNFTLYMVR